MPCQEILIFTHHRCNLRSQGHSTPCFLRKHQPTISKGSQFSFNTLPTYVFSVFKGEVKSNYFGDHSIPVTYVKAVCSSMGSSMIWDISIFVLHVPEQLNFLLKRLIGAVLKQIWKIHSLSADGIPIACRRLRFLSAPLFIVYKNWPP